MKKLIIIGNGFDLAHGLPTSYGHFLENVFKQCQFSKSNLININYHKDDRESISDFQYFNKNLNSFLAKKEVVIKNTFLKFLYQKQAAQNWVDVESYYFLFLKRATNQNIDKIQEEFESVKKELESYLQNEIMKYDFEANDEYLNLFLKDNPEEILFLTFNYTPSLEIYKETIRSKGVKCNINYIHGKFHSEVNPVIFGYGDENSDYLKLLDKNENRYLKNIKSHSYNRNYSILKQYLKKNNLIKVCLFGHSCGLSDRTLLNEIFIDPNVENIEINYYKDRISYKEIKDNVVRIFNGLPKWKEKIIDFEDSKAMPQIKLNIK